MISLIHRNARILRFGFRSAMADLRAMYTWKTWSFGWLVRVLCQVAFFSLIGKMVGSHQLTVYLAIGNAVFIVTQAVLLTISSTAWERLGGTLPLLVAAPGSLFTVFTGRSVQWMLDGVACGVISLFVLGPIFGVTIPLTAALLAIPILILVAFASYAFSLFLGALVLRAMGLRVLVTNICLFLLMLLTGVQVPISFWPRPVTFLSDVLPVTHGLQAIRSLIGGASGSVVAANVIAEAGVALLWLLVAALVFRHLAESGRRDGSIEFG